MSVQRRGASGVAPGSGQATPTGPPPSRDRSPQREPRRPESNETLGFTRKRAVSWFSPAVLADAAQRVVLSSAFGDFLDKRELQKAAPIAAIDRSQGGEIWIDYLADTADGFDATYSMAWLTAQQELNVEGHDAPLPRGSLLVLGGDEVYPSGDPDEYDNRFRGPFKASLPHTDGDKPLMLALPGNHDWYDGLTNFMRVFCQGQDIGGRATAQTRSYFAVELPHRWWIWGIDIQFDSYIDDPQLEFFDSVAEQMGPGARLILATAVPSWVDVAGDPHAYRNLGYLESRVIRRRGIELMLSLSGDSHHYAHYEGADEAAGTHKITAGGGGAFLHPTHHNDEHLPVPIDPSDPSDIRHFHLAHEPYPDRKTSRRLSWGALALPFRNPRFLTLPAVVYLLLGWSTQFATRTLDPRLDRPLDEAADLFGWGDILLGLVRNPVSVLVLLVVTAGLIGFAKPSADWSQGRRRTTMKLVMGLAHTAGQVAVGVAAGLLALKLASPFDGALFTLVALIALLAVGALAASLTMGLYVAVCCAVFRSHGNEAFSAMALPRYKNFLRLHIDRRGVLTVYPIGLERACTDWRYDAKGPRQAPWLNPADPLEPKLIHDPVVIGQPVAADGEAGADDGGAPPRAARRARRAAGRE